MKKFDKEMILNYALRGMEIDLEEALENYKVTRGTRRESAWEEEVNRLKTLIRDFKESLEAENTELVD